MALQITCNQLIPNTSFLTLFLSGASRVDNVQMNKNCPTPSHKLQFLWAAKIPIKAKQSSKTERLRAVVIAKIQARLSNQWLYLNTSDKIYLDVQDQGRLTPKENLKSQTRCKKQLRVPKRLKFQQFRQKTMV